jgi:hypothetical protein
MSLCTDLGYWACHDWSLGILALYLGSLGELEDEDIKS